ncbi:hypothetical protein, partial [Aeromonas caviae]|uniref:hypothetical protein n=1 Tax=Aeromonas caviae TaxID=648 RepID=UPI0025B6C679
MRNGSHFKHYIIDISFSGVKERVKIEGAFFDECDIQGNNGGMKITFKNCKFEKVYFGYSKVNDVNFENGAVSQINHQATTAPAPSDRYTRGFLTGRPRVFSLFMALTYAM